MSTSIEKLAKLFKERDNPYHVNITVATVESLNPFKIRWGTNIVLSTNDLVFTSTAKNLLNSYDSLHVGDKLIVIPDIDFKTWYIIDKVG